MGKRPVKVSIATIKHMVELRHKGMTYPDIAKAVRMSVMTTWRIIQRNRTEIDNFLDSGRWPGMREV